MLADAFDERLRIAPLIEEDDVEEEAETFAEPTEPDAAATQRQAAKGGAAKWRGRVIKSLIGPPVAGLRRLGSGPADIPGRQR